MIRQVLTSFNIFFKPKILVFAYNKLFYAKKEADKTVRLIANNKIKRAEEARSIAKCSKNHQNVHCPKFNVKKFVTFYKH